jgi:hypothetical protein
VLTASDADSLAIRELMENWAPWRDAGDWERFATVWHRIDGVTVDVVCTGRFYDFCARHEGQWKIVRRQPIYEKDRLDAVDPAATLSLDPALLARFPAGYRHLGHLQTKAGFTVKTGLPGLTGEAVTRLYGEGAKWLAGSPSPGEPL